MKIYKHILISISAILLVSCQDFLNVEPSNVNVVSTYEDVKALMGTHLKMFKDRDNSLLSKTTIPFFPDPFKENLLFYFYSDNYDSKTYLNNWITRRNTSTFNKCLNWENEQVSETLWTIYYDNIGFYNTIIQQVEKFPSKNKNENNIVKGEAKVLRAWSFFKLVQYFSPYHKNEYGLPLNTDPDFELYNRNRQTQLENYDFIINELKEVLSYKTPPSASYNLFFNKNIINAILAQVYLYKGDSGAKAKGDYENAIKHAKAALIEGKLSLDRIARGQLSSSNGDEYGTFTDKPYALFTFIVQNSERIADVAGLHNFGAALSPSESLYTLFNKNDKRKDIYFDSQGKITKYTSKYPFNGYFYKLDLFTGAELQLIIAEAYARQGKNIEAEQALKEFTDKRYTTYKSTVGKSLLTQILEERRKEFCFEYDMRWIDLNRLQKGWNREALDKDNNFIQYTIKDGDHRFCLPIPLKAELSQNKIKQNPGW